MPEPTMVAAKAKPASPATATPATPVSPAAEAPLLVIERPQAGVAVVTLNRPQARNALSLPLIAALHAAIDELAADAGVAAIVLAAAGPVFCSGHDLKELAAHRADADKGLAFYTQAMTRCAAMMQSIVACPKPVIAAVQGTATAAGCQLVATCDLAVAAQEARFATPGVNIGLFCSTPMVALSRNIGRKQAMQMLLLGDMISAADAVTHGLVNRAVPAADVLPEAIALAARIASKSPLTVALGKAAFYAQAEMPLKEAYAYAAQVMVDNMMARDAEEGISAFLDKRPPQWTGC
jgi:enoyl-CoA hydratase/carnithine racemase